MLALIIQGQTCHRIVQIYLVHLALYKLPSLSILSLLFRLLVQDDTGCFAISINCLIFVKSFIPLVSTPLETSTPAGVAVLIACSTLSIDNPPAIINLLLSIFNSLIRSH